MAGGGGVKGGGGAGGGGEGGGGEEVRREGGVRYGLVCVRCTISMSEAAGSHAGDCDSP